MLFGEMSKAQEIALRSKTMEITVELLNEFGAYLHAECDSPVEDQLEAALDEKIVAMVKEGPKGMAGHVLLCLVAIIHNCSDPDQVQEFFTAQSNEMMRQARALNGD